MVTESDLIGLGRVGCVKRFGDVAVKTANQWPVAHDASEYTMSVCGHINRTNEESLMSEGRIYQHLAKVEGVLKPFQISDTEIRMPYIRHGSLEKYLNANQATVDIAQLLRWFHEAAEVISRVHERRVIVADIAARNFLVNDDLEILLCDFSESVIIPEGEDLDAFISEDFLSFKLDIARFGSMIYKIVSSQRYEFFVDPRIETDLDEGGAKMYKEWPTDEQLPNTEAVFLGDIIRRCWLKDGFSKMKEVCTALQSLQNTLVEGGMKG
ncbi:kinase-like domain-containing protein [Aspergillus floccosus]